MKKLLFLLSLVIVSFSCTDQQTGGQAEPEKQPKNTEAQEVVVPELQTIIDSAHVSGSVLLYDLEKDTYYSNDFEWATKGYLPASTYKITNSIIALETGAVENDSTLFKWNGEKRKLKVWEQDLLFRDAFHYSCVPCYQKVARKIGAENMNAYLKKLDYGNMQVDSTNIDLFWLEGESQINQFQQIDFLKRLYQGELPISKRTETIIKRMIVIEDNSTYKLSGKTGWSIRNGNNNGWFVGYITYETRTVFFATNVTPHQDFTMNLFPMIRKEITFNALEQIKSLK